MSKTTQKYIVCQNKDCKFGAEKCPHAHSSYDWVPTNDLYIKYPGIWDVEHRENVSKAEGIEFLQTLEEMKKLTTYYRTKMDNHCAQNIGRVGAPLQPLGVEVEEDECVKIAKKEFEERVKFLRQRETEWERLFQEGAVLLSLNRELQQKLIDWNKDCQKWEVPNNHPRLALL
jgi:hypothetical protein